MVDGSRVQNRIDYGYAKCATKIGSDFKHYRSSTPINPIALGNLLGTIKASTNVTWDYMKSNRYGNSVFNIIIDAQYVTSPQSARVGDYIVGIADTHGNILDKSTYFISALQYLLPPKAVQCNNTINIIRPTQNTGAGNVGYSGYTINPFNSTTIMTAMPASVLIQGRSDNDTKLPTDTNEPSWIVLIPNLGNVEIRIDDIIIDNSNQNYVITNNELTDFGWRLNAKQIVNSR
jgi:hypothetical protein